MVGLRKGVLVVAAVLAAVVGAVVVFAVPAARGGSQALVLNASLAPSLPTDPTVFGVSAGSVPWVLTAGKVQLQASGMLHVSVEGLVVPPLGDTNPVSEIAASVYCNGSYVMTTPAVPFSSKGNAQIDAMVTLPPFCPAPAVLLNPAPGGSVKTLYIGFDGTGSTS